LGYNDHHEKATAVLEDGPRLFLWYTIRMNEEQPAQESGEQQLVPSVDLAAIRAAYKATHPDSVSDSPAVERPFGPDVPGTGSKGQAPDLNNLPTLNSDSTTNE